MKRVVLALFGALALGMLPVAAQAGGGCCYPIVCGGCSVNIGLSNARPIGFSTADGSGEATSSRVLPGGVAGRTVRFQALDLGDCDTSNITTTTF